MRSSRSQTGKKEKKSVPDNTKNTPVIEVTPLNSMPYVGPSMSGNNKANENAERKGGPSMILLPSEADAEFLNLVHQAKTGAVALTGSAALGKIGYTVGLIDIAESDDSYFFRVSLPGVSRDEKDFNCEIEPDGKIMIRGNTITGEKTICRHNQVFKMITHNMCPPGPFTLSFQLPGPVSCDDFNGNFASDGVLEGLVKKLYYED